jgi:small GTP-binding protein
MKAIYSKKIVLIGPSAVGKTSLVLNLLSGKYNPYSESTIGASFCSKLLEANDGIKDKVEIWDTAGQERYKSLVPMYYRNALGALIVYDVTNTNANEYVNQWIKELKKNADENIKIIIVGNKFNTKLVLPTALGPINTIFLL